MHFALAALSLAASAVSATAAGSAQSQAAAAKKPKKICRLVEANTGTRLSGRKSCKIAEEWALDEERNRTAEDLRGVKSD